jgi:c-di-GMP-binding flagellar brake protein YcgR
MNIDFFSKFKSWFSSVFEPDSKKLLTTLSQNNLPCLLTWPNIPYSFSVSIDTVENDIFIFKMLVPDFNLEDNFFQHATFTFNYLSVTYQFTCSVFKNINNDKKDTFYAVIPNKIYKVHNRVAKRLQILPKFRIPITFQFNDGDAIVGDIWNISLTGVGVILNSKFQHNFISGKILDSVYIVGKNKREPLKVKIKIIWTSLHRDKLYLGCSFVKTDTYMLELENFLNDYKQ